MCCCLPSTSVDCIYMNVFQGTLLVEEYLTAELVTKLHHCAPLPMHNYLDGKCSTLTMYEGWKQKYLSKWSIKLDGGI